MSKAAIIALVMMAAPDAAHAADWQPSFQQLREVDTALRKLPRRHSVADFSSYYLAGKDRDYRLTIMGILISPHTRHGYEDQWKANKINTAIRQIPVAGLENAYLVTDAVAFPMSTDGVWLGDPDKGCKDKEFFSYDLKTRKVTEDECAGVALQLPITSPPALPVFKKPHV